MKIHTILQPNDFSNQSQQAFEFACNLAKDYGAKVILLHVVDVPVAFPEMAVAMPNPEALRAEARDLLKELKPPADAVQVERRVVEGEPASEILRVAEDCRADLIVVGTHGRSGIRRVVMGSVAEQVLRHASCPVLAVKVPSTTNTSRAQENETRVVGTNRN